MAFKPTITREGGGPARLFQFIRAVGYNAGGTFKIATVTSEFPNFSIRVQGDTVDTPSQGIICNPDLFDRKETVQIDGVTRIIEYPNRLVKGAMVYVFEPEHGQLLYVITMAEEI